LTDLPAEGGRQAEPVGPATGATSLL